MQCGCRVLDNSVWKILSILLIVGLFRITSVVAQNDSALVAHWKFDEGSGIIVHDFSGNGHHANVKGAIWEKGKIGKALYFDGLYAYCEVPYEEKLNLQNNFTVSLWFKCENNEGGWLISKGVYCSAPRAWALTTATDFSPPCPSLSLILHYGGKRDSVKCDSIKAVSIKAKSQKFSESWHHAAMVYSNRQVKFYHNGELIESQQVDSDQDTLCSNNNGIIIGKHQCLDENNPFFAFKGLIDEVRLYNRVLSDSEVLGVYNADEYNNGSPIVDHIPPTPPRIISITSEFPNRVDLEWRASKDRNGPVKVYRLYRDILLPNNRTVHDSADVPSSGRDVEDFSDFIDTTGLPLSESPSLRYSLRAYDLVGNQSAQSKYVSIQASSASCFPVFPGAEGFGVATRAGRRGKIFIIDSSTADPAAAQLVRCIEADTPRTCIFKISGTIDLGEYLRTKKRSPMLIVRNPYLTIAGQTAPTPGVTIKGCAFWISTHDVLIQHIRFRPGDIYVGSNKDELGADSHDGLGIVGATDDSGYPPVYNVVVDHCSISWAVDENVDFGYRGVHDITISNCIISEGLNESRHPKGPHSCGLRVGWNAENVSLIRNLLVHNGNRNPLIMGNTTTVIVNNVVYNPGPYGYGVTTGDGGPMRSTIVGNVFIPGCQMNSNYPQIATAVVVSEDVDEHSQIYVWDNCVGKTNCDQMKAYNENCTHMTINPWAHVLNRKGPAIKAYTAPIWVSPLTIGPADSIEKWILDHVGARPADVGRDAVDIRIINDVRNGKGKIINNQHDVGGWPELAQYREITPPTRPNADDDGDGYTNLEEWLHDLAKQVESRK